MSSRHATHPRHTQTNHAYPDTITTVTTTIRRGTRAWRKLRNAWTPLVNTGKVTCRRCHKPIRPGQPWDLGHLIDAALGGTADGATPEHAHCNRSDGATTANHRRHQTHMPSRTW